MKARYCVWMLRKRQRDTRRGKEVIVQYLFLFIPFSKGTPETLITCTCEHTKSPTHQSGCGPHPSSHSNLLKTPPHNPLPSCLDTNTHKKSQYCTNCTQMWTKKVRRRKRGVYSHPESPRWRWWGTCRVSPDDRSNLRNRNRQTKVKNGGWERD